MQSLCGQGCCHSRIKPPLTYYGGKQQLTDKLLTLIPAHHTYCETFLGGAALFFAKGPSAFEVVNDTNNNLITFYKVLQTDFASLQHEIQQTPHSRHLCRDAVTVYQNPHLFTALKIAWAVWTLANQGYCAKLDGAFGYDRTGGTAKKVDSKRSRFQPDLQQRIGHATIESRDAVAVIKAYDTAGTFHYLDPPYVGADQGHYDGYTQDDFNALLRTLSNIKGKFLLSSYRNTALAQLTREHRWHTIEIKMRKSVNARHQNTGGIKIEVLTANYPIPLAGLASR